MNVQGRRVVPPKLRTGDLVFFQGTGVVSNAIKIVQFSRWSHVGIVIIDPAFNVPLIYEATHTCIIRDLDTGTKLPGVKLVTFQDSLNKYPGKMAIRRLSGVSDRDLNLTAGDDLRNTLRGRMFEKSFLQLMRADTFFLPKNRKEDLSSIFCSELVVAYMQAIGLLCTSRLSNNFGPAHLVSRRLRLLKGRYGKLEYIKASSKRSPIS